MKTGYPINSDIRRTLFKILSGVTLLAFIFFGIAWYLNRPPTPNEKDTLAKQEADNRDAESAATALDAIGDLSKSMAVAIRKEHKQPREPIQIPEIDMVTKASHVGIPTNFAGDIQVGTNTWRVGTDGNLIQVTK